MLNSRRRLIIPSILAISVFLSLALWRVPLSVEWSVTYLRLSSSRIRRPLCSARPSLASETMLVMRTGATEIMDRLPVHLNTLFPCAPNTLIFSDHSELFYGHQVIDVLSTVSEDIRLNNPDFELYRRLQHGGRAALRPEELSGTAVKPDDSGNSGKSSLPAWKVDKWKFLPMFNHTFSLAPNYKWYLFVEPDTTVFWSSMLEYQAQLDHTKPYYLGGQAQIDDIVYAHGGSGFLVSNIALRLVVEHYAAHQQEYETFTNDFWAGDGVAGKAFKDVGVELTWTAPIIHGGHPGVFPFGDNDSRGNPHWCLPSTTYHHVTPDDIMDMWNFEQRWIAEDEMDHGDAYVRYRDVFTNYIMPNMKSMKSGWDNMSADEKTTNDHQGCIELCEMESSCLQYRFDSLTYSCTTSKDPKMGQAAPWHPEYESGWMYDRIEAWQIARPKCDEDLWIV